MHVDGIWVSYSPCDDARCGDAFESFVHVSAAVLHFHDTVIGRLRSVMAVCLQVRRFDGRSLPWLSAPSLLHGCPIVIVYSCAVA